MKRLKSNFIDQQPETTKVHSPFEDDTETLSLFTDQSKHANIKGDAVRVELRKTKNPAVGKITYNNKLVDPNFIVGLLSKDDMPQEGKEFKMSYHSINNVNNFGSINSREPVHSVFKLDDYFFFATSEGEWRLEILNVGN